MEFAGEPFEHLVVDRLPGLLDRLSRSVSQLLFVDVVDRHADHRYAQESARLEPVQRAEGLLPGQVARDAERHERIGFSVHARQPIG